MSNNYNMGGGKLTFPQNFQAAAQTGDHEKIMDLFYDQVTDIAVDNPQALNTALNNTSIPVEANNFNSRYLLGLIIDNLDSNQKLVNNLANLIAIKNTPMSDDGDVNIAQLVSGISQGVGGIMGGVGAIMGAKASQKSAQATADAAKVAAQEATKQSQMAVLAEKEKSKGLLGSAESGMKSALANNKPLIIGAIVLGVVTLIGIGAFFIFSEDKLKAGESGAASTSPATKAA